MKNLLLWKIALLLTVFAVAFSLCASAYAPGDTDRDGTVGLNDVRRLMRSADSNDTDRYDLNGDGHISLQDTLLLLESILTDSTAKDRTEPLDLVDSSFPHQTGSWTCSDGVLIGANASAAERFALTDIYLPKNTALTVEATMEFCGGNAPMGGIAFGIEDKNDPASAWYAVNVAKSSVKRTRLLSSGTGTVGGDSPAQRPLTEEEIAKSTFTIRLTVDESGLISYWLDGEFVASYQETVFPEGYIGFYTFWGAFRFSNVSYRIGNDPLPLTAFSAESGGESIALSASQRYQSVDLGTLASYDGTVTLGIATDRGMHISIDGKKVGKGSCTYTFTPSAGKNLMTIALVDLKGNVMRGYLEINAPDPSGLLPLGDEVAFTRVSGNWAWEDGVLAGKNASIASNVFMLTDLHIGPGVAFAIEADVTSTTGSAAIAFGVPSETAPSWAWYGVNISKSSKRTSLFSESVGTIGTGAASPVRRTLTDAEVADDTHRLGIFVSATGEMTLRFDGEVVGTFQETDFRGGYIGFNTNSSTAVFSNIFYRIGEADLPFTAITASAEGKTTALLADTHYQKLSVSETCESIDFTFALPDTYTLQIGGETLAGNTYTFAPTYGKTWMVVNAIDAEGKRAQTCVEIWRDIPEALVYTDPYRPQYHYTPSIHYSNDPNGLVYNAKTGEYLMYYQYNPVGDFGGTAPKVWGLATSRDLVHWEEREPALGIDGSDRQLNSSNWSGSCVVDYNNTSGFFDDSVAPEERIVAIYTSPYPTQAQSIAYSLDGGYSFIKYEGNPVIPKGQHTADFRDPKVYWIEDASTEAGGVWLMVLAGGIGELYTSPDLKNWTFNSTVCDIHGEPINTECPDMYIMPLDGNAEQVKYVFSAGGTFYVVGDLVKGEDGLYTFVAEQEKIGYLFGTWSTKSYATQSFFAEPNGKMILVSWLRDFSSIARVHDKYWQGVYSFAYDTTLVTDADGTMRLHFAPPAAIDTLRGETLYSATDTVIGDGDSVLTGVTDTEYVVDLHGKLSEGATAIFKLRTSADGANYILVECSYASATTVKLKMDCTKAGPTGAANKTITVNCDDDGSFNLQLYMDNTVIEIFAHEGQAVMADFVCPAATSVGTSLTVSGGEFTVHSLTCTAMQSIWN